MNKLILKYCICIVLFFVFTTSSLLAQSIHQTERFNNGVYYLERLPPGYDPNGTKLYPLIIFLHGKGERSDPGHVDYTPYNQYGLDRVDNEGIPFEIKNGDDMCFTISGTQHCFIVLSPQRDDTGYGWLDITEKLINYAWANYKIDKTRVYLTGLSMGGIGTIDYIQSTRAHAADIAAAAVAPGGEANLTQKCTPVDNDVAFWAVQGRKDSYSQTNAAAMENFVKEMNLCNGASPKATVFVVPGAQSISGGTGHYVWDDFYNTQGASAMKKVTYAPTVYEWFLRNPKGASNFSANQAPELKFANENGAIINDVNTTTTSASVVGLITDYDGTVPTYNWSKTSSPTGSSPSFAVEVIATPTVDAPTLQYKITVNNMSVAGEYKYTLYAKDNLLRVSTKQITITKSTGNLPPTVSISSPPNNFGYTAPATVTINATANDPDGTIARVEFYNGSTKLGEDLTSPYSFTWNNVGAGQYSLKAKAVDNLSVTTESAIVKISVTECTASGNIKMEKWDNIQGTSVSAIPVANAPNSTLELYKFETPQNQGIYFGTRVRGYLCVPVTGNYKFMIASDDNSELWLSTNDLPANKVKIASVTGATSFQYFDKYPTQRSAAVALTAGKRYYIEALQKENGGNDHLTVGWELPDGSEEIPIPGTRLSPFAGNSLPVVSITSPVNDATFNAGSSITINANATDADGNSTITKVEFFRGGTTKLGEDLVAPYTYNWTNVAAGEYLLTAKATDNTGGTKTSAQVKVIVTSGCTSTGTIVRELWTNATGNMVASIPLSNPPTSTSTISGNFQGPTNSGDNYGARYRGYLCAPQSGSYVFSIASDDHSELWLSTDAMPSTKQKIAYVQGATSIGEWTKFASQTSAPITLTKGRKYYIEVLHKEGGTYDHLAVGWQKPDGTLQQPMPTTDLSPYVANSAPTVALSSPTNYQAFAAPTDITLTAAVSDADGTIEKVEFFEGENKIGDDLTAPFSIQWEDVESGEYFLTAQATDNLGAVTTCDGRIVTVTSNGQKSWHSYNIQMQSGTPQSTIMSTDQSTQATVEYYVSSNDFGVDKTTLFNTFTNADHPNTLANATSYWANTGTSYPYAAKSKGARGAEAGEANSQSPLGVFDLQLHPPNTNKLAVAAFIVPMTGRYMIYNLGARRVGAQAGTAKFIVFDQNKTPKDTITVTNDQDWVNHLEPVVLGILQTGDRIYFAVSRDGVYDYDFTEVTWSVSYELPQTETWNSFDLVMQNNPTAQAVVSSESATDAVLEFYESTDDFGVNLTSLFSTYNAGEHTNSLAHATDYWANGSGSVYPYAGVSTDERSLDNGETGAPQPHGVFDLQLHPPSTNKLAVCAFVAPVAGTYTLSGLAARRVSEKPSTQVGTIRYRVFDHNKTQIANIQASNDRAWVVDPNSYQVGPLNAGDKIYFATDRDGNYEFDFTEVSWTLTLSEDQTGSGSGARTSEQKFTEASASKTPETIDNAELGIALFPNPAEGSLTIRGFDPGSEITLLDNKGQVITRKETSEGVYILNVVSYPNGIYYLVIRSGGRTIARKFIKQ
jgi:hypothetical protein